MYTAICILIIRTYHYDDLELAFSVAVKLLSAPWLRGQMGSTVIIIMIRRRRRNIKVIHIIAIIIVIMILIM